MKKEDYQEIDLLDYLNVLVKRRKMIIRNVFLVAGFIALVSFIIPSSYRARTTILPPEETRSTGIFTAISNTPLSNLLLTESGTTSDLFVEILKSRSVLDGVLLEKYQYPKNKKNSKTLSLLEILKFKSLEKGRKKLMKKISVEASQEGIIKIDVEMNDPLLAADVANSFVAHLDKINKEKSTSRAKNSRVYIENQLKLTEKKLAKASDDLTKFRQQHKAVSLEAQTEAAIKEAGELKGKIFAKEVELNVALQSLKPDHIAIIKLKKELEELKKQYNYLQYGNDRPGKEDSEFFIPFSEVPEVGTQLAKLLRELKVQETVWELLNQQYYQAKIQEARDTPTIQVLDEAVPPETRSKPKRKLLVLVGAFLTFIFSVFFAYAAEFFDRLKQDKSSYKKVQSMINVVGDDVEKIKTISQKIIRKNKSHSDDNKD